MSISSTNSLTHSNAGVSLMNGNNSSTSLTTSNLILNSNSGTTSSSNQVTNNLHSYNNVVSRGMKENLFFAAINQLHNPSQVNKPSALVNSSSNNNLVGFLQPAQQLASNLIQHSNLSHANSNLAQFQQTFQNQIAVTNVRFKNGLNVNGSLVNSNNQPTYRSLSSANCKNTANSHYQLINSHLINNSTTVNGLANNNNNNNTGNILLNISNHNNHSNNHFNHFTLHSNGANSTLFNGYQLNYHVQQSANLANHHHHHINSLSSSPRSSTSSNSSTSSSIMNYDTTNNCSSKHQNGQHSPTSSISPTVLSNLNHHSNNLNHISSSTNKATSITSKPKNISNGTNYRHQTANGHGSPTNSATNQQQHATSQQQQSGNSNRYKTELCRPFEESGFCKYSDKCQYAHGQNELRSLQRHPKYKTELCRTFHTTGFCPYGPRCHFIHYNDGNNVFSNKDNLIMDQFNSSCSSSSPSTTNTNSIVATSNIGKVGTIVSPIPSSISTATSIVKINNGQSSPITSTNQIMNSHLDVNSTSASSTSSGLGSLNLTQNSTDTNTSDHHLCVQQSLFTNTVVNNTENISIKQHASISNGSNLDLTSTGLHHDLNLALTSSGGLCNNQNDQLSPTKNTNSLLSNSSSTSNISLSATSSSGNASPLQQQFSSLSSKASDDVFYKYL